MQVTLLTFTTNHSMSYWALEFLYFPTSSLHKIFAITKFVSLTDRKDQKKWKPAQDEASNHDAQCLSRLFLPRELEQSQSKVGPVSQRLVLRRRRVTTVYPQSHSLRSVIRFLRFTSTNESTRLPPGHHVDAAVHGQDDHQGGGRRTPRPRRWHIPVPLLSYIWTRPPAPVPSSQTEAR